MSYQTWQQTLAIAPTAGAALTASTTQTSLLPSGTRYAFPASWFQVGSQLQILATGIMSTVTTPGTLQFFFTLGTIATPINAFSGGSMALAASVSNVAWFLEMLLTVRALGTGTSANLIGTGQFTSRCLLGAPAVGSQQGIPTAMMPDTSPVVGTGWDSTQVQVGDLQAAWNTNNANTITLYQYNLQSLN
jgi:hypothetical protein